MSTSEESYCELIGGWVENGEYPADMKSLEGDRSGISYYNAVKYFGFDLVIEKSQFKRVSTFLEPGFSNHKDCQYSSSQQPCVSISYRTSRIMQYCSQDQSASPAPHTAFKPKMLIVTPRYAHYGSPSESSDDVDGHTRCPLVH